MLSNLLWWPWHGIGSDVPPPDPGYGPPYTMGDRRLHHENIRRHPPDEDELEAMIAVILSEE